jgi:L-rhamnose-H+ transport protein
MDFTLGIGILLAFIGGSLEGLFSLPLTRTPRWRWENTWGLGLLMALLLVPWPLAFLTVPHLLEVYSDVETHVLVMTFLFGIGWGLGALFWSKAIAALGMALGVSLMMGLINVFGSPLLLAMTEPGKLAGSGGFALMIAVAITIFGVVVCAMAGRAKQRELHAEFNATKAGTSFVVGLMFCILSGILSASVNFGFVFGEPIAEAAQRAGASDLAKNNAVWALVFTGNFLINAGYAFFVMFKKKTLPLLVSEGSVNYCLAALFLGLALPAGIVLYGIGAIEMGKYGAFVAFPMMLVSSILFGNLAGAMTGEWKGASARTKTTMMAGVLVLVIAFVMFGVANKLLGS